MAATEVLVSPEEFSLFIEGQLFRNYTLCAGLAWYIYDYLLTVPTEISVIWKSKLSLTNILFFANRYLFIILGIFDILAGVIYTKNSEVCSYLNVVYLISGTLSYEAISMILLLRAYAIYDRSYWVLTVLLALLLVRVGLDIWFIIDNLQHLGIFLIPYVDTVGTCVSLGSIASTFFRGIPTAISDILIFVLTVSQTWVQFRRARAEGLKTTLSALLLRDGSLYFGLICMTYIVNLFADIVKSTPWQIFGITYLFGPLQAILINRLILNLRSFDQTSSQSFRTDTFSTNRYDPSRSSGAPRSFVDAILGDIGRPLRTTDDEDLDEFNEDFDQSEDTNEHA